MITLIHEINPWIILSISVISILVSGLIGSFMASQQKRNKFGWFVVGMLFPLFLIILIYLKPKKDYKNEVKTRYRLTLLIGLSFMLIPTRLIVQVYFRWLTGEATEFFLSDYILRYIVLGLAIYSFVGIIYFLRLGFLKIKPKKMPKKNSPLSNPIQRLSTIYLIIYSFILAVALYGMILFYITNDIIDYYIFMYISLIYFVIFLPRYKKWKSFIENYEILE